MKVSAYPLPQGLSSDKKDLLVYGATSAFSLDFAEADGKAQTLVETFLYDKGAFRFVGEGVFPFWVPKPIDLTATGKKITPPRAIYSPDPAYDERLRQAKVQGIPSRHAKLETIAHSSHPILA